MPAAWQAVNLAWERFRLRTPLGVEPVGSVEVAGQREAERGGLPTRPAGPGFIERSQQLGGADGDQRGDPGRHGQLLNDVAGGSPDELSGDRSFTYDLGLDSLSVVEVVSDAAPED